MRARSDIDPDQIFSPFDLKSRRAVIAAVSGGSDSLAMLLLLQRRLERQAPGTRLVAVTVDHRLRPTSAAEAEAVGQFCAARGILHRTPTWAGEKPATGLSVAARLARYRLLSEAAAAESTDIIVTGHTADDQAETVAMRQARGDGRGLAGMAPATLFDGEAWIVRPLLATARAQLRAFLRAGNVAWIDDPTNVDARYERPRLRASLGTADDDGSGRNALLATARAAAALRVEVGGTAARLIAQTAERPEPGLLKIAPRFLAGDDEAAVLALRVLLAVCGGVDQLPERARVEELFSTLHGKRGRATLSRTVVDARADGLYLYRERRGLPPAAPARARMIWDGRYRLEGGNANTMVVPALAVAQRRGDLAAEGGEGVPASVLKVLAATRPGFIDTTGAPVSSVRAIPVLAPWRQFLPSFDLAVARAVATLIGAPKIPEPPFASHNGEEG